jgi:MFS family permease
VRNLASMVLLIVSQLVAGDPIAYGLLLVATACLGAGFGLTAPTLNILTAVFHPARVDRSVLTLNALLGLGTALAPAFVAIFVGLGFWWGLPMLSAVLLVGLLLVSVRLPLRSGRARPASGCGQGPASRPGSGSCRLRGPVRHLRDHERQLGPAGDDRAAGGVRHPGRARPHHHLGHGHRRPGPGRRPGRHRLAAGRHPGLGLLAFGLAGLGCSALLPLTISFGQEQLTVMSASVAGGVIAFYQLGYGIAAFGAGPLQDAGVGLSAIFGLTAVAAVVMGGLSFVVAARQPAPSSTSG